jgi:hypothetical protein
MTDKELLAIDLSGVTEELDRQLWSWQDMGDNKVCPDCLRLSQMPPATLTVWQTERTEPGRGDTVCGDYCRCIFFPEGLLEIYPDLKTGGKIIIPDEGRLILDPKTTYETFRELDDLIVEYKTLTSGKKLPPEYFAIESVDRRIVFLRDWLR